MGYNIYPFINAIKPISRNLNGSLFNNILLHYQY
jgi:hypothetical protein